MLNIKYLCETYAVVQCKPCIRTIRFCNDHYRISLPYQVFTFQFVSDYKSGFFVTDQYLYFRKSPLGIKNNMLYLPPLPNINSEGAICLGGFNSHGQHIQLIKRVIDKFWQSKFNDEYDNALSRYNYDATKTLKKWTTKTKQNPGCWEKMRLLPCERLVLYDDKPVINSLSR